jgi:hypothetical protein
MTEPQPVWVIPPPLSFTEDIAPLPALHFAMEDGSRFLSFYNRRTKQFESPTEEPVWEHYETFEDCRVQMMTIKIGLLDQLRKRTLETAQIIEHLRTIPIANFPNVLREVREAEQEQQEKTEGRQEEKAEAEQVRTEPKRPSRRN